MPYDTYSVQIRFEAKKFLGRRRVYVSINGINQPIGKNEPETVSVNTDNPEIVLETVRAMLEGRSLQS